MLIRVFAVAAAVALLVCAAVLTSRVRSAPAPATWSHPVAPASHATDPLDYTPVVAADGTVRVVWTDTTRTPTVNVATLTPGDGFGAVRTLARLRRGTLFAPAGLDADGRAVIVYHTESRRHPVIRAIVERPDATMAPEVQISPQSDPVDSVPTLAVDDAGDAITGWSVYKGDIDVMQVAVRPAGGVFGAPVELPRSALPADGYGGQEAPTVAASGDGHLVVAYEAGGHVLAATGTIAGGLGPAQVIGAYPQFDGPGFVTAAINDDGRAAAAWDFQPDDPHQLVAHAAIAAPGQPFGRAVVVGTGTEPDAGGSTVAVTGDGTTLVAYPKDRSMAVAAAPADRPFAAPQTIDTFNRGYPEDPMLAGGPDTTALLTWTTDLEPSVAQVSTYTPARGFGTPAVLSSGGVGDFPVAVAGVNTAVVAWTGPSGLQAATLG